MKSSGAMTRAAHGTAKCVASRGMGMITMTMALSGPHPMRKPAFNAAEYGAKKKIGVTAGKIRVKFGMRAIKQPATNAAVLGNQPTLRTPKILMGGACQNGMKPITNQLGSITSSQDAG